MKFGGTSVGDPERIKHVARRLVAASERRRAGRRRRLGDGHDDRRADRARPPGLSAARTPRELDMLLSVGERISCALVAMAIHDLGREAISLTGSQAGIVTDTVHGKAKIVEVRARRINEALERRPHRARRGLPGHVDRARHHDTRPGRHRHDRGRARGRARGERVRDLHGRRGRLHGRSARRPRRHASSTPSATRRCSRWPRQARKCFSYARSSSHGQPRRQAPRALDLRERGRHVGHRGGRANAEQAIISGVTHTIEEAVYRVHGTRAADLFDGARRAST